MIHARKANIYNRPMQGHRFRKNEGLILICQNNEDESLVVFGANERAQEITGYSEDFFKGRSLTEIVPRDIRESLEDYIEYDEEGADLAKVLGRIRDFRLINAEGDEVRLNIKVVQAEAKDRNLWYRLILRDDHYEQEVEEFRHLLNENFKGHEVLDAATGLPDRNSLMKDMEVARFYTKEKELSCCFAVFRLDRFEELRRSYGKETAMLALRQLGANIKRNLRGDDAVGRIGEDLLGVILVDITQESARVVLGRLRWLIAAEPLMLADAPPRQMTAALAFSMMGDAEAEDLLALCENALAKDSSPNAMIEK